MDWSTFWTVLLQLVIFVTIGTLLAAIVSVSIKSMRDDWRKRP